jgi:hypothetical protein
MLFFMFISNGIEIFCWDAFLHKKKINNQPELLEQSLVTAPNQPIA